MTTKQQYKLAYRLLRSDSWDYATYGTVAGDMGITVDSFIAALRSYRQSRLTDEIGESYRNLRSYKQKLRSGLQ